MATPSNKSIDNQENYFSASKKSVGLDNRSLSKTLLRSTAKNALSNSRMHHNST